MNTSNVIRSVKLNSPTAPTASIKSRATSAWRNLARSLFTEQMVGNPLHEAWTASGEPLERMCPDELAKSHVSRYLVVPHSRGR
jgi:hypothetical protein